jgi:hypothetical protein
MRRVADPLALDPLGPMEVGPSTGAHRPPDPLSLDPLSPIDWAPRRIDADTPNPQAAGE